MAKITNKQGYNWLEDQLKDLKQGSKLFYMLKSTLLEQGYWRNKGRGNPKKGYYIW